MNELYITLLSAYLCGEVTNKMENDLNENQIKKLTESFAEVALSLITEMSKKSEENKLFNTNKN